MAINGNCHVNSRCDYWIKLVGIVNKRMIMPMIVCVLYIYVYMYVGIFTNTHISTNMVASWLSDHMH